LQLTVGIDAPLRMGGNDTSEAHGRVILVAANHDHWFESEGWAAVLWMEPASRVGRLFADGYLKSHPMSTLPEAALGGLWARLRQMTANPVQLASALEVRKALESAWFGDEVDTPPLHPAMRRAVAYIRGLDVLRVSADDVARQVGVSKSHLLHLFSDQLGIPLRRYVLWLRHRRAIEGIVNGASATDAAHAAGFHDSAHLTRSFQTLAAITPSDLLELRKHGHFAISDDDFE
jgi:AraC-like DNA-binding protein